MGLDPETIRRMGERALSKLPNHVPTIYPYMDKTLALETTLRESMEKMTSEQFEQVLHPIFQEDELTLIIAGAVLGLIAGLIQQGLETGAISAPDLIGKTKSTLSRFFRPSKSAVPATSDLGKELVISQSTKEVLENLKTDAERIGRVADDMSSSAAQIATLQGESKPDQISEGAHETISNLQFKAERAGRAFRHIASSSVQMIESKSYVVGAKSKADIENLQIEAEKAISAAREVAHTAATIATEKSYKVERKTMESITNLGVEAELASAVLSQIASDIAKIAEATPYEFSRRATANINNLRVDAQFATDAAARLSRDIGKLSSTKGFKEGVGAMKSQLQSLVENAEKASSAVNDVASLSTTMATAETFENSAKNSASIQDLQNEAQIAGDETKKVAEQAGGILASPNKLDSRIRKIVRNIKIDAENTCTAAGALVGDADTTARLVGLPSGGDSDSSETTETGSVSSPVEKNASITAQVKKLQNDAEYAMNVAADLGRDVSAMTKLVSKMKVNSKAKGLIKYLQVDGDKASRAVEQTASLSAKIADSDLDRLGSRSERSMEKLQFQADLAAKEAKDTADLAGELLDYNLDPKLKRLIRNVQNDAEMAASAASELATGTETVASLAGLTLGSLSTSEEDTTNSLFDGKTALLSAKISAKLKSRRIAKGATTPLYKKLYSLARRPRSQSYYYTSRLRAFFRRWGRQRREN